MIEVRNLVRHYDNGAIKALNGVSLTIDSGEVVALMGPSGSGKSTLLNLMSTIDKPTDGEILINGIRLKPHQAANGFRARTIGFVFQFHHLIPHLTLTENVEIPMLAVSQAKAVRRRRAHDLLEQVGLAHKKSAFPNRVSGGERQLAAIARSLANDPKIIMADEPTGSVDTVTGDRIVDHLISVCREKRLTMVMATHNIDIAGKADRIIYLRNGCLDP